MLGVIVLAALGLGRATGHLALIDRSDSMKPAIAAGDVVVVRQSTPAEVGPGDVVTFTDPTRPGQTITHRVVKRERQGTGWAFETRGDANSVGESWTIASSGSVGRLVLKVPQAGRAVALAGEPVVRFFLLTLCALALGGLALRRVWAW